MEESGLAGFDMANWYGIHAPRDLPDGVSEQLRSHLGAALKSDRLRDQFLPMGVEITTDGEKDFAGFNERDRQRWQAFFQRNQIKLETS